MICMPKNDYLYLMSRADNEFKNTISAQILESSVRIAPAAGKSFDDVAGSFGGLIEDTLDDEYEATPETYKIEAVWDNYFAGHGDDQYGCK